MMNSNKMLVAAVINNDKYEVNQLLATGVDVNQIVSCTVNRRSQRISYTTTVLTLAVRLDLRQMVKLLLKHGADPNVDCEMTPLGVAAQTNNVKLVVMLLEAKASVNILTHPVKLNLNSATGRSTRVSNLKQTPLHIACRKGFKDVVKCLALHRALNSVVDYNNETPSQVANRLGRCDLSGIIESAASDGPCCDLLTHLYSKDSVDKEVCVPPLETFHLQRNWTAKRTTKRNYLHLACIARLDRFACFLLSLESVVSVEDRDVLGCTPLHYACMFGLLNVAELLVERGADVSATDSDGETPFDISLKYNHMDVAFLLIEHQCTILPKHLSTRNSHGNTLLHIACQQQRAAAVRHLLKCGAGLLTKNARLLSPMLLAGLCGNVDVLMKLVDFVRMFETDHDSFYLSVVDELVEAVSIATGNNPSKVLPSTVGGRSCCSESVCRRCRKINPDVTFHLMKRYILHSNVTVDSCFQRMKWIGRFKLEQLVADCCCNCTSTILHAACANAGFSGETYRKSHERDDDSSYWWVIVCELIHINNGRYGTSRCGLALAKFVMLRSTTWDVVDDSGNTAMHIACLHGDLDAIKHIASSTANAGLSIMYVRNNESRTPLWCAFVNNHVRCVKYILQTLKVKPDDSVLHGINSAGNTLLSVIGLKSDLFFSLLDMGARINTPRNERINVLDFISGALKDGYCNKVLQLIRNGCQYYEMKRLHFPGCWNELVESAISAQYSRPTLSFVWRVQRLLTFQPDANHFRTLMTWWMWLYEAGYPPDLQAVATLYAIEDHSVMTADDRDWLAEAVGSPQSLLLQCVRAVRRQLVVAEPHGATIIPLIDQLPLPNLLKTRLKLSDKLDVQLLVNPLSGLDFVLESDWYDMSDSMGHRCQSVIDERFEELVNENDISAECTGGQPRSAACGALRRDIQTASREKRKKLELKCAQKRRAKTKSGHRQYNLIQPLK